MYPSYLLLLGAKHIPHFLWENHVCWCALLMCMTVCTKLHFVVSFEIQGVPSDDLSGNDGGRDPSLSGK